MNAWDPMNGHTATISDTQTVSRRLTRESRPRRGRQQFTWELRTKKHSRQQFMWELQQFKWELRMKHSCERFTWELQFKKHSCKQLNKTWPMLRRTMTWLTVQSWNTHIFTKMRNTWNGNTLTRGISMKMTERLWILCRSEQVLSAKWRSWQNSVLVNRATVRRRERCGQHDGVTDGKR